MPTCFVSEKMSTPCCKRSWLGDGSGTEREEGRHGGTKGRTEKEGRRDAEDALRVRKVTH